MLRYSLHEGEGKRQEFLSLNMKINEQPNLFFIERDKLEQIINLLLCPSVNIVLKNTIDLKLSGLGIHVTFCNICSLLLRLFLNTFEITSSLENLGEIKWSMTGK